jgi:pentatricopeptide repeat protein
MCVIWISLGKIYQAFNLSVEVAGSRKRTLHKEHQDFLESQVVIGITLRMRKKYSEAMGYFQDVYEQRKKVLGAEHPLTLNTEREIGVALSLMKQPEKALPLLRKVYQSQKTVLGNESPDTVKTQLVLVDALTKNGDYKEADKLFQEGLLNTMKKLYGKDHPNVLGVQFSLAVLKEKMGKRVEAFKLHRMVYYERKFLLGEEHPSTLQSQHEVTNVVFRALREERVLIY